MRVHIKSEEIPSVQEILAHLENSKNFDFFKLFLSIYYGALRTIAGVVGFESVRISLADVQLIMQYHSALHTWVFDFKKL